MDNGQLTIGGRWPCGPARGKNATAGLRPERVRRDESRLYAADIHPRSSTPTLATALHRSVGGKPRRTQKETPCLASPFAYISTAPAGGAHCQLSIFNCQLCSLHSSRRRSPLSIVNFQLSIVLSAQPRRRSPIVNCQLSIVNCSIASSMVSSCCSPVAMFFSATRPASISASPTRAT